MSEQMNRGLHTRVLRAVSYSYEAGGYPPDMDADVAAYVDGDGGLMKALADAIEGDDILETLEDVVGQACDNGGGTLDSMALSAYADGLRVLARHKRVVIDSEHGRRILAHWPNTKDNLDA